MTWSWTLLRTGDLDLRLGQVLAHIAPRSLNTNPYRTMWARLKLNHELATKHCVNYGTYCWTCDLDLDLSLGQVLYLVYEPKPYDSHIQVTSKHSL